MLCLDVIVMLLSIRQTSGCREKCNSKIKICRQEETKGTLRKQSLLQTNVEQTCKKYRKIVKITKKFDETAKK